MKLRLVIYAAQRRVTICVQASSTSMRFLSVLILVFTVAGCQNEGDDYLTMAEVSNQALTCSALAGVSGQLDEAKRLHELGMRYARQYMNAARAGELPDAVRLNAPDPWKVLGPPDQRGPSDQKVLGTVQSIAIKRAMDSLEAPPNTEEEKLAAANAFAAARCDAVGR